MFMCLFSVSAILALLFPTSFLSIPADDACVLVSRTSFFGNTYKCICKKEDLKRNILWNPYDEKASSAPIRKVINNAIEHIDSLNVNLSKCDKIIEAVTLSYRDDVIIDGVKNKLWFWTVTLTYSDVGRNLNGASMQVHVIVLGDGHVAPLERIDASVERDDK